MAQRSNGAFRWFVALVLGAAALPLFFAWHHQDRVETAAQNIGPDIRAEDWVVPGEIAVQLKPGNGDADLLNMSRQFHGMMSWAGPASDAENVALFTLPPALPQRAYFALLAAIRRDGRVEAADTVHRYAIPERETDLAAEATQVPPPTPGDDSNRWKPNDPRYPEQWNLRMVHAEEAWEHSRGKGVTVAVIDTGVAYADTRKGPLARDFNKTRFVPGYDFVGHDTLPNDDNGHGTHVAGTIAESTDNGEGVAGLAFECSIMPIKVLSASGSGRSDTIAQAIRWAADHGANVINMSLGGPLPDMLIASACRYAREKGVAIVCAAGNSGREGVGYPAAYKDCIAVSSVGPSGDLAFYSSWGTPVAIAAPGGDKRLGGEAGGILQNTVMRNSAGELADDYYAFQGTSMASPHVAATAALIMAEGIRDPDAVRALLQRSAQKKAPSKQYGAGILDAAQAVKSAEKTAGDAAFRFWMAVGLFGLCALTGYVRKRAGSDLGYPFWGTAAIVFGLLLPDWLTGWIGEASRWNLAGHSVLIPVALLVMGADGKTERRLLGWMAFGLSLHVGWELLRGTWPFGFEAGFWQMLPWAAANVLLGFGLLISGLSHHDD